MGTATSLEQQAIWRVIRWRADGYWTRLGQAALIASLAWLITHSVAIPIWFAAITVMSTIDTVVFKRVERRVDDRRLRALALVELAVQMSTFASIGPIMLIHPSPVSLAGAALLLCAITLSNTVMTRGWPVAMAIAVGSSSMMIVLATPLAATFLGYGISRTEGAVLEVGAIAYVAFIGLLVSTLNREGLVLHEALTSLEQQRDFVRQAKEEADRARAHWRMLFDQSPLPQVCFDASRLYDLLRAHVSAGEANLGDVLRTKFANVQGALDLISLTDANKATEALFGVARFDDNKMDVRQFDDSFLSGFCDSLNRVGPDGSFPPYEAKVLRTDGTTVDVSAHVRTIPGDDRPWRNCIVTYVDMTEVRRAAKAQQGAIEAAEAANRAKSEFLAIMSHEIRTPLNGVLGMAQAMAREALSKRQRARLEVIGQSGETLLTILNDILDLSKIEAGMLELESATFDLEQLVGAAHVAFRDMAARKSLDFTLEVASEVRGVYRGDSVRVRQILYNLTSNALKFTHAGSVALDVAQDQRGVRITVTDTGVGVPADRVERLFDKFVQADSSTTRQFGGTGLGLAICRELCTAMGGDITVDSEPGRGSRFSVVLPLERVGDAAVAAAAAPAADMESRPLRILAAEDNAVNQLVLRTLLGQAGLEPVIVGNGQEAVEAWEREVWDVILMDVQMPVMDGPSATRRIRRREVETGRAPTPIIALTANAMTHQAEAYRAAGMDGFVAKPIEVVRLFQVIAEVVRDASDGEPEAYSLPGL